MRRFRVVLSLLVVVLLVPVFAWSQDLVVSTAWLQKNLKDPQLVVLDVRKVEDYKAGHIPGAVNVPYTSWVVKQGDLQNQLPPQDELFDVIGKAGIKADSYAVVVGKTDNIAERTSITRVAWTLKYAGLTKVSILDGGQNKWAKEKKVMTKKVATPAAAPYQGKVNAKMVIDKETIKKFLAAPPKPFGFRLVDTREPEFWLGEKKLDFVAKAGRIPGAKNLPTSKLYNQDGTFKNKQDLAMAIVDAIGDSTMPTTILYCDTGKTCTGWALVLADVGYVNPYTGMGPMVYEGSMEEWAADPNDPMETGAPKPPAAAPAK